MPGWVKDLTLEELKKLSAGSWFHSDFKDETIPTLHELLTPTKVISWSIWNLKTAWFDGVKNNDL